MGVEEPLPFSVIAAAGIMAPELSDKLPWMVPAVCWANAADAKRTAMNTKLQRLLLASITLVNDTMRLSDS